MKDHTDYIITFILVAMCAFMVYGFWDYDRDRIEQEVYREEQEWRWSVWRARGIRCFRQGYLDLYVIEDTLQTVRAEMTYNNCMK